MGQKKCIKCNEVLDPFLLVAFFLTFGKFVSFTELSFPICNEEMLINPIIP